MSADAMYELPAFDRSGEFDDLREVLDQPCVLKPHDDRTDQCVAIPVRLVISAITGPAVEVGPFTLDTAEVVKLYNALAQHVNAFPANFRVRGVEERTPTDGRSS